jgi:glutamine cyclotransferase
VPDPTPSPDVGATTAVPLVSPAATITGLVTPTVVADSVVPVYTYQVVNVFPHDPAAFTQGLVYQDSIFYEGTGLRGQSTLRKVDPATGAVLQGIRLPDPYFGEGIAVVGDRLYQLTWQENTGFIYDKDSFELLDTWSYEGEGWGLATDGQRLIMSDGSNVLRFLDPATLQETGRVGVVDAAGQPVPRLNELEWVEDEVWANVWQTDLIARIDPASGRLLGWIDLTGLLSEEDRSVQRVDVLNGIAYDPATGRLFVTGKWWPKLFEIELAPEASP